MYYCDDNMIFSKSFFFFFKLFFKSFSMNCAFYNELIARALDNTLTYSKQQEQQIANLQAFIADLQATIANLQATNENLLDENRRLLAFVASSPQYTDSQSVPEDGELSLKRSRIETPCSSENSGGECQTYFGEDGTNRLLTEYSDTPELCTCPECTAQTVNYQFSFGEQQCSSDEDRMYLQPADE